MDDLDKNIMSVENGNAEKLLRELVARFFGKADRIVLLKLISDNPDKSKKDLKELFGLSHVMAGKYLDDFVKLGVVLRGEDKKYCVSAVGKYVINVFLVKEEMERVKCESNANVVGVVCGEEKV